MNRKSGAYLFVEKLMIYLWQVNRSCPRDLPAALTSKLFEVSLDIFIENLLRLGNKSKFFDFKLVSILRHYFLEDVLIVKSMCSDSEI